MIPKQVHDCRDSSQPIHTLLDLPQDYAMLAAIRHGGTSVWLLSITVAAMSFANGSCGRTPALNLRPACLWNSIDAHRQSSRASRSMELYDGQDFPHLRVWCSRARPDYGYLRRPGITHRRQRRDGGFADRHPCGYHGHRGNADPRVRRSNIVPPSWKRKIARPRLDT
jgi:hypothetical protein